jgi:hypothetical protein
VEEDWYAQMRLAGPYTNPYDSWRVAKATAPGATGANFVLFDGTAFGTRTLDGKVVNCFGLLTSGSPYIAQNKPFFCQENPATLTSPPPPTYLNPPNSTYGGATTPFTIMRFTIPNAGEYKVSAQFLQTGGATTAIVYSQSTFNTETRNLGSTSTNPSVEFIQYYLAGDIIDFAVGPNDAIGTDTDATRLMATVQDTSCEG